MCNRYTLVDPDGAIAEIARILGIRLEKPEWVTARYNLGLMQTAPAVLDRGSGPEVLGLQFGAAPKGVSGVIGNARAETALSRRTFKSLVPTQRCLVPTTGFIDWETDEQNRKRPHLFTMSHGRPFTLAGIWDAGGKGEDNPPHFFILTTAPNEVVGRYHDRMPVILPEERVARWVDPAPLEEPEFREIARSYPGAGMAEREISDFANNSRHEGPDCLAPPQPRPDQLGLGL